MQRQSRQTEDKLTQGVAQKVWATFQFAASKLWQVAGQLSISRGVPSQIWLYASTNFFSCTVNSQLFTATEATKKSRNSSSNKNTETLKQRSIRKRQQTEMASKRNGSEGGPRRYCGTGGALHATFNMLALSWIIISELLLSGKCIKDHIYINGILQGFRCQKASPTIPFIFPCRPVCHVKQVEFIMPTACGLVVKIDYLIYQITVHIMHCIPAHQVKTVSTNSSAKRRWSSQFIKYPESAGALAFD